MAGKSYSEIKANLKKFSENITFDVKEDSYYLGKAAVRAVLPLINQINETEDLDEEAKEELVNFICSYTSKCIKQYLADNPYSKWAPMVNKFLEPIYSASWKYDMESDYEDDFDDKIKGAIADAKQKNKQAEEKKPEKKQDKFTMEKNSMLAMLGYVPGKRGSQDNSKDIDSWAKNNISKGQRGMIINDILKARNEREVHSLLDKSYNLAFKNGKFVRLR